MVWRWQLEVDAVYRGVLFSFGVLSLEFFVSYFLFDAQ